MGQFSSPLVTLWDCIGGLVLGPTGADVSPCGQAGRRSMDAAEGLSPAKSCVSN